MKYIIIFPFFLFFFSCNNSVPEENSSPENVVRSFFQAIHDEQFELAEKYLSINSKTSFKSFLKHLESLEISEKNEILNTFKMDIQQVSCNEIEGVTKCNICCSEEGEIQLETVVVNNQWFIQAEFGF